MLQESLSRIINKLSEDLNSGYKTITLPRQDATILLYVLRHTEELNSRIDQMHEFLVKIKSLPERTNDLESMLGDED